MSVKGYTEEEWYCLVSQSEGNSNIMKEISDYANKKEVEYERIGVRWVRGRSQYYIKPEKTDRTMNFD